ncbi:uncharacterized protein LOC143819860 [Paroedura picta]|uniref:uncharacterized protein LOC143819860 n=1 Tax=Paroedura picta TaxID=143630 RepID=UPI0040565C21
MAENPPEAQPEASETLQDNLQNNLNVHGLQEDNILANLQQRIASEDDQTGGLMERMNQTLKSQLRALAYGKPGQWDLLLDPILFAPQASTGYSPLSCCSGGGPEGSLACWENSGRTTIDSWCGNQGSTSVTFGSSSKT